MRSAKCDVLLQAGRMLKFIRGKGQQPSAERQKLQNELFAFRKVSARNTKKRKCFFKPLDMTHIMCHTEKDY